MTKAIAQTYTYAQQYRALATLFLAGATMLAVIMYAVNVYGAISHSVSLSAVEKQIAAVQASVGELDARYLDLGSAITPDSLHAYGLAQGEVTAYIPRTASAASVSTLAAGYEF